MTAFVARPSIESAAFGRERDDVRDFVHALNDAGVDYLIVGGYAVSHYGTLRTARDFDVVIGTARDNAERAWRALRAFGAPLDELRVEDLTKPATVFVMGRPPDRIDVLTTIDGVSFEGAWGNRIPWMYDGVLAHFISRADSIAHGAAAARRRDATDVASGYRSGWCVETSGTGCSIVGGSVLPPAAS